MVKMIKFILYEFFHNKRRRKKERYGWGELLQCELKITECTAVSDVLLSPVDLPMTVNFKF